MNIDMTMITNFITVAECGSFAKASENLHVSRQLLAKQITRLEGDLGCRLFSRSHTVLSLTDPGTVYYHFFKNFLDEYPVLLENIHSLNGKNLVKNTLRLGILCGEILEPSFICILETFQQKCPNIQVVIEAREPYELQKFLLVRDLDLIINFDYEINPSPYINSVKLWTTRNCIFACNNYPGIEKKSSYMDFADDPCFISTSDSLTPHNQILTFQRIWEKEGVHFSNVKLQPNLKSLITNVELGTGVTMMTKTSALGKNDNIRAFPLGNTVSFLCVWNSRNTDPNLKILTDLIKETYELS